MGIWHVGRFENALEAMEQTMAQPEFPQRENVQSLAFLYGFTHKMNQHFMTGTFHEGLGLVTPVLEGIKRYENTLDEHHIMVFYYKIACLYFGCGAYKDCIFYLNKIIANKSLEMREDLSCFSRILNLVAHYEAGQDYQMDRLINFRIMGFRMNWLFELIGIGIIGASAIRALVRRPASD